jgi:hypothetical protein
MPDVELGKLVGASRHTIRSWRRKAGILLRRAGKPFSVSPEVSKRLADLLLRCQNLRKVSLATGFSDDVVLAVAHRNGIVKMWVHKGGA